MFYFNYKGIDSRSFKIRVNKVNNLATPKRKAKAVPVDGRNGDLLFDTGAYENRLVTLECQVIAKNHDEMNFLAEEIAYWLQGEVNYYPLTLSDNVETYYEASCISNIDIERVIKTISKFHITFECKPFRRDKIGDFDVEVTGSNSKLFNPTKFVSTPLYKLYGTAEGVTIQINNKPVNTIKKIEGNLIIDTDLMDIWKVDDNGTKLNKNSQLEGFFEDLWLEKEVNDVKITGIDKVIIVPRWNKI